MTLLEGPTPDPLRQLLPSRQVAAKSLHAQEGHPRREIRINRPRTIPPDSCLQKEGRLTGHLMLTESRATEAHRHESGQRGGLQEAAMRRLQSCQDSQGRSDKAFSHPGEDSFPSLPVSQDPHGDQSRDRVAHDRQAQEPEQPLRQYGGLERQ